MQTINEQRALTERQLLRIERANPDHFRFQRHSGRHERTLPLWLLNQLSRPRDVPVTNVVAMLVMMVTMLPILGAYYLTRGGESVAGSGGK